MNEYEKSIYDNPHPESIVRNSDGTWSKVNMYCYSVYMMYRDFLVKNEYENSKIAREYFINSFGFHDKCREYLLQSNYSEFTHRTLYSVLYEYIQKCIVMNKSLTKDGTL